MVICRFNPRTHTGCDVKFICYKIYLRVVSIHAPTRGATGGVLFARHIDNKFQSTHPHGVRPSPSSATSMYAPVSIHAPTRGATNPVAICLILRRFQSTHPHGVRPRTVSYTPQKTGFNPRTHTGCDPRKPSIMRDVFGFNPRTHTGCDRRKISQGWTMELFQSTHPHGVRLRPPAISRRNQGFNPRTHTGCDSLDFRGLFACNCFNPRTHTGCDTLASAVSITLSLCFNPRTHTGCDAFQHLMVY